MIVWTAINSAAIVLLTLVLYLTLRQVGLLLTHLGPGGARASPLGPRVGENLSFFVAPLLGAGLVRHERMLYVFATESCPVCAAVREAALVLARHWASSASLVLVYDALAVGSNGAAARPANYLIAVEPTLRHRLDIRAVPYAVVTDRDGLVLGHGLVNNASHLESLLEIKDGTAATGAAAAPAPSVSANQHEGANP